MRILQGVLLATSLVLLLAIVSGCSSDTGKKDEVINDSLPAGLSSLNKLIGDSPDNADLYQQRALWYLTNNDPQAALADINKAITIDGNVPAYYRTLSDIYFAMGKTQRCRDALSKAIQVDDEDTNAFLKLAELEFYFKNYPKTFEYIEKVHSLDAHNAKGFFIKGMAFKEIGDTARAVKFLQMAVESDQEYYYAYMQLGLLFSARHNPLAVDYFNNALNLNPESLETYYALGMYYQENEQYNKAIESYTTLLKIDPEYKTAHFNLGYIHLVYLQVYDVAAKHFTDALKVDPNYAEAFYNRGYCYELMGDVMGAKKDYQQATMVRPNYQRAIDGLNRIDAIINK